MRNKLRDLLWGRNIGKLRRYLVLSTLYLSLLAAAVNFARPRLDAWLNPPPVAVEPTWVQEFEAKNTFIDVLNIRTAEKVIYIVLELIRQPGPEVSEESSTNDLLDLISHYRTPEHINLVLKFVKDIDTNPKFYFQNTISLSDLDDGTPSTRSLSLNELVTDPDDLRWNDK